MPAKTFTLYCIVFGLGVALACYVLWWRQTWVDAGIAAFAVILVLFPLFAGREFRFVRLANREHVIDLQAQKIAGNEMLRVARERDRLEMNERTDAWAREYAALASDHATLKLRLDRPRVNRDAVKALAGTMSAANIASQLHISRSSVHRVLRSTAPSGLGNAFDENGDNPCIDHAEHVRGALAHIDVAAPDVWPTVGDRHFDHQSVVEVAHPHP